MVRLYYYSHYLLYGLRVLKYTLDTVLAKNHDKLNLRVL